MRERLFVEKDRIYGENTFESPIICNLIASSPLQRLKGLSQFGVPDEFYHLVSYSRFEHSLGVMMLLKRFNASEEEQVAGLLHDVSHKAFSHVYDWVVGTASTESSQDDGHLDFLKKSEIAEILEHYEYSVEAMTDYHRYGLLERESPDLCADRVDYSLREFDPEAASKVFNGLMVYDGQIVCRDRETAALFGRVFLDRQMNHWGEFEGVARYHIFSKILKYALGNGIIQKEDFSHDDDYVVSKMKASADEQIINIFSYLRQRKLPQVHEGGIVHKKFRYIDPLFLSEGKAIRLSETDDEFSNLLEDARKVNSEGILVPNISIKFIDK